MTLNLTINTRAVVLGIIAAVALVTSLAITVAQDGDSNESEAATIPATAFTYQGRLELDGVPANGPHDFRFSLYSNEAGTTPAGSPSQVVVAGAPVTNGLFTASLDFGPGAFNASPRWLKVEAKPSASGSYVQVGAPQQLTSTPSALFAHSVPWSGITGVPPELGGGYANVVVVAKSGAEFSDIQEAIDSLTDVDIANRAMVWVAPGRYNGPIIVPPGVDLVGARYADTIIQGSGSASSANPLVTLSEGTSMKEITVQVLGTGSANGIALVIAGSSVLLEDSLISSFGATSSTGISSAGNSQLTLRDVTVAVFANSIASGVGIANGDDIDISDLEIQVQGNMASGMVLNTAGNAFLDSLVADATATDTAKGLEMIDAAPMVTNSRMVASGGVQSVGVASSGAFNPRVRESLIFAGGGVATGYQHRAGSEPMLDSVEILALGTTNRAVANIPGDSGTAVVSIHNSTLLGSTNSVHSFTGTAITYRIAHTKLDGPKGGGTFQCVGAYNGIHAALSPTC